MMESGFTLLDKFNRNPVEEASLGKYTIILNKNGQVVWYSTLGTSNIWQLPNGNLIYRSVSKAVEASLLGAELRVVELAK